MSVFPEATILILDTDYDKFKVIAKKDLPKGLWMQDIDNDSHFNCNYRSRIKDLNSCYNTISNNEIHDGLHVNINTFNITV